MMKLFQPNSRTWLLAAALLVGSGLANSAHAQVTVGSPPPGDLGLEELLQAPKGSTASWEAFKGKVVVLEFWATWCVPCVAAFPHLNELKAHYKDRDDIVFLAITDESREVVEKLLKDKPLNCWIGLDTNSSVLKEFGVQRLPRTILIDKTGKVAADTYPTMVSTKTLDAVLAGEAVTTPQPVIRSGPGGLSMPSGKEILTRQRSMSPPTAEHKELAPLSGEWSMKHEFPAPPIPDIKAPTLKGTARGSAMAGGRFYKLEVQYEDFPGESTVHVFGYDAEKSTYVLHQFSLAAPSPVVWTGSWDQEHGRFTFQRPMEMRFGMPGDKNAETMIATAYLEISWGKDGGLTMEQSADMDSAKGGGPAGMPRPSGRQPMGTTTFLPAKDSSGSK